MLVTRAMCRAPLVPARLWSLEPSVVPTSFTVFLAKRPITSARRPCLICPKPWTRRVQRTEEQLIRSAICCSNSQAIQVTICPATCRILRLPHLALQWVIRQPCRRKSCMPRFGKCSLSETTSSKESKSASARFQVSRLSLKRSLCR